MPKNKLCEIVGETTEGDRVVKGIYAIKESLGLPLDVIFDMFMSYRMYPDWNELLDEAIRAGVNKHKFFTELKLATKDSYGVIVWNAVEPFVKFKLGVD